MKYYYSKDVLKYIDSLLVREQSVRLTILNKDEMPIKVITGYATGGSISVNGKSAVRRTGSLTLISSGANEEDAIARVTDIENLISINKRILIEIGLKNTGFEYLDKYSSFWFPMGAYVIKSAQVSNNGQNINISVSFSDKMALLNGDCGGKFTSALIHSPIGVDDGAGGYTEEPVKFRVLIEELVNEMGGIPIDKIMIEDVPETIKAVVRWTGSDPVYIKAPDDDYAYILNVNEEGNIVRSQESMGYQITDYTYPGKLESAAGDTVVSVLDKIKNALGNFEYFFDEEGVFHFKQIKDYINDGSASDDLSEAINEKYLMNISGGKTSYEFTDKSLFTSCSNSPVYQNIKNDIILWGKTENNMTPIRYHLIIDEPPIERDWFKITDRTIDNLGNTRAAKVERASAGEIGAIKASCWHQQLYLSMIADGDNSNLAKEFKEEFPKIFTVTFDGNNNAGKTGWKYRKDSNQIGYFLDMLSPSSIVGDNAIKDISVEKIGYRNTVINDNAVNCIFDPKFEDILFTEDASNAPADKPYVLLDESIKDNIAVGIAYVSAYETLRAALHTYTSYANTINIQCIPIYYLLPNTRIYVEDKDSDIKGDFMISSLSIPFDVNGTMSISAYKADERI